MWSLFGGGADAGTMSIRAPGDADSDSDQDEVRHVRLHLATASQGHPDLRLCGWQMFEDDTDVDGYRYGSEVFSFGSGVRHRLGHGSEEATPIPSSCLPACTGPLPP